MKFAFLCVVIIISCSVCASGDLEIYPGLKFDLSSEEQRQGLADDNTVDKSPLYRKWPLLSSLQLEDYREPQEIPKEPDFDFPLPLERFRNLERLLKANRLRDEEDLPLYYDPKGSEEVFERYPVSSKIPRVDRFDELRFNNPSVPILDDVRPYPQDDDFTFGDEEEEDEENNVINEHEDDFKQREPSYQTGGIPERIDNSHESQDRRTSGGVYESRTTPEASGRGALDDAKMVDDPTQFAYSPSDIRFFQNAKIKDVPAAVLHPPPPQHHHHHQQQQQQQQQQQEEHQQKASSPKAEKLQQKNQQNQIYNNNKFHVTHRSDQQQQQHEQQTVNVKFAADEFDPDDLRRIEKLGSLVDVVAVKPHSPIATDSAGMYIIATVAGIGAAAIVGLIAVGIGWYNLQKHVKSASDVDYPAYGVTGPNKDTSPSSGDRRLAQSAQMYHYQHQKQQIIAMESRAAAGDRHGSVSEADSDEENEEGDYTVYECPGLAPTGEMEVKNPLFLDDPTPAQTPPVKPNGNDKK